MDMKNCNLCPRNCGVDRLAGGLGYCRMPGQLTVAHADLHHWEEPVISGNFGSGTVFFTGCGLGCIYCQNQEISLENAGTAITPEKLRSLFLQLIDDGAENINLVTATQFLPWIMPALSPKLPVPVVYNCGGYESVKTLKSLEGLVDIYLPDLKYMDKSLSKKLSNAPDYPEVATAAILEMYRQTGDFILDEGLMKKGVLIRHLILPGETGNSLDVLDWISGNFKGNHVLFSLMAQYVPHGKAKDFPPLDRPITEEEYAAVVSWAEISGLHQGFIQERTAASDQYLPRFNMV
ncbi:MAG: radical SAM protein [Eubacteriales bacterium]